MSETEKKGGGVRIALACFGAGLFLACLVAAIAIPNVIQMRKQGAESAPIGALKTIATAESIFREGDKDLNGVLDYGSLAQLGRAQLIDGVLASGTKQGYLFRAAASSRTSEFLWFATAAPVEPRLTGDRYFCSNNAGVVFYTTAASFAMNTTDCSIPANAIPVGR